MKKIGVIGVGAVGSAVAKVFDNPLLYDKYKGIGSIEEVNKADIIFLCVPTPYAPDIGFDLSAIENAFSIIEGEKIVVIKSTVLPGTTDKMQKLYPHHKVLFNPELLRQRTAEADMKNPNEQIVGYTENSKDYAQEVLDILPNAPNKFIVKAREAEMVKYFSNSFLASKVVFANQIFDLCEKLDIDYDKVKEIVKVMPRIGESHLDIWMEGFRGYSGACFPKDVKALIQLGDKSGVDLSMLKLVDKTNQQLLEKNENTTN